jgi:predicted glutamine amidotransferase
MCRMMGVVSRGPVYYDLFEEFADLSTKGMAPIGAPDERGHRDGWGLLCFQNGVLKIQMKDVGGASEASRYYGTAWKIAKLNIERAEGQSLIVLGHLRRASDPKTIGQRWSHPFVEVRDGATWAFQHNGSLNKESQDKDTIDSQILFHLVLEALDGRGHAAVAKATRVARQRAIEEYGGFTGLNFMMTDGAALHAYRDFQTNGQYYTLYQDHFGEMVITTSEPILAMKADPMPRGVLYTVTPDLRVTTTAIA